ncbi:hypothetical protein BDC45DRAFT_562221, partial [Circinella umbellata]
FLEYTLFIIYPNFCCCFRGSLFFCSFIYPIFRRYPIDLKVLIYHLGRGWAGSPPPSFLSIYFSNFDIYLLEVEATASRVSPFFDGAVHGFRTIETRSRVTGWFVPLGGGGGGWHLGGWLGGEKAG